MMSRYLRAGMFVLLAIVASPLIASAQMSSPNYSIDEVFIGSGGELEACSDSYCTQQSAGGTGGQAESDGYGIMAGFSTPDEPTLSLAVTNNIIDLGLLNETTTAAASANFTVSNYLSNGYIVRVSGPPPTNATGSGSRSLTALSSPNPAIPGTEQFGINLVANSDPGIGMNPVQQPDSSFAYGTPTIAYDQEDNFKYEDGDIIAESLSESGQTDYTMSIIANVGPTTAGGRYRTVLVIQAIAVF
ncbi:hypothetical protein KC867_00195 [Candidatus Saccharibacteria bacterium]|nr:hypothetical protein [Candidatus Saccharibacteria bacterium]